MPEIACEGCRPEPLLDYLKGLGLFRLIATQRDPDTRAFWRGEMLVLDTSATVEEIEEFLLEEYSPSPLADPWNKDSGFPSDKGDSVAHRAVRTIIGATAARLERIRLVAAMCDDLASRYQPDDKEEKKAFLSMLRASVPDYALEWLDAVFVLTEDKPGFPPLLGSGGNDGRLDFVNCFMRSVLEVMDPESGSPRPMSRHWLRSSLHDRPAGGLLNQSTGQFDPGGTGGANASCAFAGGSLANPWSFILALEGTLVFSAAATRRLDAAGGSQQAFPFTVSATRAGYASRSENEKLRGEIWMPLWNRPASFIEIDALFSEGRATLSGRTAHSGLEFARSVASLGVDRGLDSFTRYMFAERNGKNNYAVPLGRFRTLWSPQTELLDEVASWVSSLHKARESSNALAAVAGSIEDSMLRFCQSPGRQRLRRLFLLLGDASTVMARSPRIPSQCSIPPLDRLSVRWISETSDGSPEYRLAASLASIYREQDRLPLRMLLEPISIDRRRRLVYGSDAPEVPPSSSLLDLMTGLLDRMSLDDHSWNHSNHRVSPGDVAAFLDGYTDDGYLLRLLRAMLAVRWGSGQLGKAMGEARVTEPGAEYWILKFCWTSADDIPGWEGVDPAVVRAAVAGSHRQAAFLASVRLKALGRLPMNCNTRIAAGRTKRIAASLLFPVQSNSLSRAAARLAPAPSDKLREEGEPNVG